MTYAVPEHITLKRVSALTDGRRLATVRSFRSPQAVMRPTLTLIMHGERDYRCPISEGLNLFEALQYHKVPSELLVFPDENHWILKPKNIVVWYEAVLDFLARHMT